LTLKESTITKKNRE